MNTHEVYSENAGNLLIAFEDRNGRPECIVTMNAKKYHDRNTQLYDVLIERLTDCIKKLHNALN